MSNFQVGDIVYIVENNRKVSSAVIRKISGGFYSLRISASCVIRLKEHRIFGTYDEALESLRKTERSIKYP